MDGLSHPPTVRRHAASGDLAGRKLWQWRAAMLDAMQGAGDASPEPPVPLHDISTDTDTPPAFVDVLPLRRWALNPPGYGGPPVAALQRQHHADIRPLVVARPMPTVHAAVRDLMREAGWRVVGDAEAFGRLEAVATTPWLRFRDDVVVRLTLQPDAQVRVDMRSKSRIGRNDFGVNATRVRTFLARLASRLAMP